jgi:DNA-binding MarR family transcriptional regulator
MSARADAKDKLRVWLRLLRTTRAVEGALRESLRTNFDTTLPRFDVMAALVRAEAGLTMTALSRQLLVSNGNVTGIVERLVVDRLVSRADEARDKRATRVRLTSKGRAEFATMAAAHEMWVAQLLDRLDAADVRALTSVLAKAAPEHLPDHLNEPEAP